MVSGERQEKETTLDGGAKIFGLTIPSLAVAVFQLLVFVWYASAQATTTEADIKTIYYRVSVVEQFDKDINGKMTSIGEGLARLETKTTSISDILNRVELTLDNSRVYRNRKTASPDSID